MKWVDLIHDLEGKFFHYPISFVKMTIISIFFLNCKTTRVLKKMACLLDLFHVKS